MVKTRKKVLGIILALAICVSIFPLTANTVSAAVDNTSPIYTKNRQLAESFVDKFEAVLLDINYCVFNTTTGKMEYLSPESAEPVDISITSLKVSDACVLIFERTGNNFHIKRKSDGKYMKRQGDVISWVDNPSTAYTVEYRDNCYNIYDSDNDDSLWSNESNELMFNSSRYLKLSIYMKSGYMITYKLGQNSSYNSCAWLADDAATSQFAHFIPENLPLTETNGRIIEYWKDGDNNRYVPGKDYNIDKSLVLTPVYHTHEFSQDPVIADGNTIGYVKHTCTCGASYLDGFAQEVGVKKVELAGDSLKITYTDGTIKDLDSIKGDKGDDGRQIELRTTATHIQWRYIGDSVWTDLIALSDISGVKGDKGDTGAQGPQGDKGDTGIQGDKGDKGDTGAQGPQGDKGNNGADGKDGHTPFIGENGNWWIGETDTGVSAIKGDGIESVGENSIVSAKTNEKGELVITFADGSTFRAVNADTSVQAMSGVSDADGNKLNAVKTIAIIALILSAVSLLSNGVVLTVALIKKKA